MLGGKERSTQVPPDAEEVKEFWSKLCDKPVPYKEDSERLKEVEVKLENGKIQENVEITKEDVTMQLGKVPNWKAPGLDETQGFWIRRFTSQHQRLTEVLNENIQSLSTPNWLLKSRTALFQKDSAKGNAVGK